MNKNIKGLVSASLIGFSSLSFAATEVFDFDSTFWQNNVTGTSFTTTNNGNGTFTQTGQASLFSASLNATLNTSTENKFGANDTLSIVFKAGGKTLSFTDLNPTQAEAWLTENADEIASILFANNLGTELAGEDSAASESSAVLNTLILTPSKGKAAKKAKGITITENDSASSGVLSYTGYENGGVKGKRYGITLGYDTDLTEKVGFNFSMPYTQVDVDDSVNTSSQIIAPALALSYKLTDTDDKQIKIGMNLQVTGTYSKTDLTDLGYLRYSSTIFGSYRYFMNDDITLTGGLTFGYGQYTAPGVDDPTIKKIFEGMGTDQILGFGGLIEYDIDEKLGVDFSISGTHNFNSKLNDGRQHISFGPQIRYTVMDTFDLNIGYRRTQKLDSTVEYTADTIMMNALYKF